MLTLLSFTASNPISIRFYTSAKAYIGATFPMKSSIGSILFIATAIVLSMAVLLNKELAAFLKKIGEIDSIKEQGPTAKNFSETLKGLITDSLFIGLLNSGLGILSSAKTNVDPWLMGLMHIPLYILIVVTSGYLLISCFQLSTLLGDVIYALIEIFIPNNLKTLHLAKRISPFLEGILSVFINLLFLSLIIIFTEKIKMY